MKKNYFLLAASTMMFAACAQNDLVDETVVKETTPQAIGFETFAQKATRAENSTDKYTNGLMSAHHDKFSVWAYKNTSDVLVFGNETATNGTVVNSSDYKYEPLRYWDKTADWYEFYAAAPSSANWKFKGNVSDKAAAYFTMEDAKLSATNFVKTPSKDALTTFKGLDGDVDWMIADKCNVKNESYATTNNDVQLNFIHILSRLNIIVKKGTGTAIPNITLNSIAVKGIKTAGSFNESKKAADETGTTERWTTTDDTKDYTFNTEFNLTTENNYMLQSLVIPQDVTYQKVKTDGTDLGQTPQAYIKIQYTINDEIFNAYYNLAAVFGATSTTTTDNSGVSTTTNGTIAFNEGWQNTLTITIAPAEINFEGNVAAWVDNKNEGITIE